jgi:uncharacterized protein (DUF2062 family)
MQVVVVPKRFIKRYLPDHHKIRNHKNLRFFGQLLHDPNLWHLNRRSVSGAFSVGLFSAFVPVPFQMVLGAAGAILWRVNLPISVGLVWLTNPVTMPPVFYFCYKLGTWILRTPLHTGITFELSIRWIMVELATIWQPFLLGCFVMGTLSAVVGNVVIRLLWRLHIARYLKRKRQKRQQSTPS